MSDFCVRGCYWPDCEHAPRAADPAPPPGTRWVRRAGLRVAERVPVERGEGERSLEGAVDEFFGELLVVTGRPWSLPG